MVGGGQAGAAGVAASVLLATQTAWRETFDDLTTVRMPPASHLITPEWDPLNPDCRFSNASIIYNGGSCSHFTISRIPPRLLEEGQDRALDCASNHDVDCVLAPEVGLDLPLVYMYDGSGGLRTVLAPRLLNETDEKTVQISHPEDGRHLARLRINTSVHVEFTDKRRIVRETFQGDNTLCIQLLRRSFAQDCWSQLDG